MKPFCEVIALEVLPAMRAMVATKLMADYGFSQGAAARTMGVTQPAVSQYSRSLRGSRSGLFERHPKLMDVASRMAAAMASGKGSTMMFCEMCRSIRLSGIGCEIHKERDRSLENCSLCLDCADFYGGHKKKQRAPVKPLNKFA